MEFYSEKVPSSGIWGGMEEINGWMMKMICKVEKQNPISDSSNIPIIVCKLGKHKTPYMFCTKEYMKNWETDHLIKMYKCLVKNSSINGM
jgi:hypothetical protein